MDIFLIDSWDLNKQDKQINYLILKESLERFCNVLSAFGFNSAKYEFNLIKSYFLPILVNEQDIELTVIKKANQFITFKFRDIQLLDIKKAYKTSETKGCFPYE